MRVMNRQVDDKLYEKFSDKSALTLMAQNALRQPKEQATCTNMEQASLRSSSAVSTRMTASMFRRQPMADDSDGEILTMMMCDDFY